MIKRFIVSTAGSLFLVSLFQVYDLACPEAATAKNTITKAAGVPYQQFRCNAGIVHWLPEQMPLKIYIAHGQSVEHIIDPAISASAFSVDNLSKWPDFAADLLEHQEQLLRLPVAEGYLPNHYQAVIDGINLWKVFEKEGLFSFVFTDDPSDADIYIFWVNHFVNNLGFGLLANDIRGYTAKRSFWNRDIQADKPIAFKPVITLLRTTNQLGEPVPYERMRAAAAHEFGHALGIEGHSPNAQDLMSIYYGRGVPSINDAATIRYLYHLTPDLVP